VLADGPPQTAPVGNNSSVRHRNPEAVAVENRVGDLQRLLEARIADRLERSTVHLNEGQYERARSVLGEEFLEQLNKYGDVADGGDDTATAVETLNDTRTRQLGYARTVAAFNETYDEYRNARENGNDQRARELARDLVRRGTEAKRLSQQLTDNYDRLETVTGSDLAGVRQQTRAVQTRIDEQRASIEDREFVATELVVREADERGSFSDPLTVEAVLTNGSDPVANRQITLSVGEQTYTVETNAEGVFTVRYRPTAVPVNASNVTLAYVPAPLSVYSASNTSLPVALEPATGRVTVDTSTARTAFGEPVAADGSVSVSGVPVSGLSLVFLVDGERLGTARTDSNGSFAFSGRLPAAPDPGAQTVTVRNANTGRAVAVEPATRPIRIRETPTTLSANVVREGDGTRLSGRLTAEARPLAGRRVVVSVGNDRLATIETGPNGSYAVYLDEEAAGRDATVAYDGSGTNLRSAASSVTIPSEASDGRPSNAPPDPPDSLGELLNEALNLFTGTGLPTAGAGASFLLAVLSSPVSLVAGGLVIGGGGFVLLALIRLRDRSGIGRGRAASRPEPVSGSADAGALSVDTAAIMTAAEAALDAGNTDAAVIAAYGAARSVLVDGQRPDRPRTHWQLFEARVSAGADADTLRTLTEAYEVAQYRADAASPALAEAALSAARRLIDPDAATPPSESSRPSTD
jgi:hypothetical protein